MTAPSRALAERLKCAVELIGESDSVYVRDLIDVAEDAVAAALLREPGEYDCAPVADALNSWCREASVAETPSAKWSDVRAAIYRLWDKLGSQRPAVAPAPTDEAVARKLAAAWYCTSAPTIPELGYAGDLVRAVRSAEHRAKEGR